MRPFSSMDRSREWNLPQSPACAPNSFRNWGLTLPESLPVYTSADALFHAVDDKNLGLDAVIIATPHRLHEEQSISAMKRGLHVLCDKPAGIYSQ